jgi:hypothetical protein
MDNYQDLFEETATYALPDGTRVTAVWSEGAWISDWVGPREEFDDEPDDLWCLVIDSAGPGSTGIVQYDVYPDGRVIAIISLGNIPSDTPPNVISLPRFDGRSYLTDLQPDDFVKA